MSCHCARHSDVGGSEGQCTNSFGLMASLTCKWNFLKLFADRDDTFHNRNIERTKASTKGGGGGSKCKNIF